MRRTNPASALASPVDKPQALCYDAAKSSTPRLTDSPQKKREGKGAAKWQGGIMPGWALYDGEERAGWYVYCFIVGLHKEGHDETVAEL